MKKNKHSVDNEEIVSDVNNDNLSQNSSVEGSGAHDEETEEEVVTEETNDKNTDASDELRQKCADLSDKNLRLMAEFDNYRKRTLKEKSDLIKTANEKVFIDFLPLIDDFERALQAIRSTEDIQAVKEGIELIYTKFINFLAAHDVKEIPTDNEPFDMDLHEAVTMFPAQSEEQRGKIVDCVSKGYMLNEKVIRFPKVVVGE